MVDFTPTEITLMVSQFLTALPAILAFFQSRSNARIVRETQRMSRDAKEVAEVVASKVDGHLTAISDQNESLKSQLRDGLSNSK
jgi:hypothetical protein